MDLKTLQRWKKYYRWFLAMIFLLWVFSWIYQPSLPAPRELKNLVLNEPIQTAVTAAVFEYNRLGKTFWVEPTHNYEISGVVVSKNHMKSLLDPHYIKYDARIQDFCIVWGENAQSGVMDRVSVRNSNFTCHLFTDNQADWEAFNMDQLANNHLLASDPNTIKTLKRIEVGDQVTLRGQLANYYHDAELTQLVRKTSTIRTDTGNGACETFFVTEAKILHKTQPIVSALMQLVQMLFPWLIGLWVILWGLEIFLEVKNSKRDN